MIITILRRNVGTIVATFGFVLLCILTFGNLGELSSEAYWKNVRENLTSIGFMSVSLTLVQTSIRQGLAEQALQRGLNTERTQQKYEEHRGLIKSVTDRMIYLPYFLQAYNKRHTLLKKREFLVNNNYTSETQLLSCRHRRLIRHYNKIRVHITTSRIKWATTDIIYNRHGQIRSLQEHRRYRITGAVVSSLAFMIGVTLITRGLFFTATEEPLSHKFIKLLTYIVAIAIGSLLSIIKEYEKGAFGVPNELDEINEIWTEFASWDIPQWVKSDLSKMNDTEVNNGECSINSGTDLQKEQEEG